MLLRNSLDKAPFFARRALRVPARRVFLTLVLCALAVAGCRREPAEPAATEPPAPLIVYSGRNEALVAPLFERFRAASGVAVEARYGESAELAATLLEEGSASRADLFLAQDAGALSALATAGRLRPLPTELTRLVDARFRGAGGEWVGLSGRARCLVYRPAAIAPEELPATLEEVAAPRFHGRFGLAPTNASFQAQIAAYRALEGEERTAALLVALAAAQPRRYEKNSAIVEAVANGEIDFGLVNHYYLWRLLSEKPDAAARNHFPAGGTVLTLVNVAGAGVLSERPEAVALVRFLLGEEAQRYFAGETFEYPLVSGVPAHEGLPPLATIDSPPVDPQRIAAELPATLEQIRTSGLVE